MRKQSRRIERCIIVMMEAAATTEVVVVAVAAVAVALLDLQLMWATPRVVTQHDDQLQLLLVAVALYWKNFKRNGNKSKIVSLQGIIDYVPRP